MVISQARIREMEDRLESLEETVEILADKKLLRAIRETLDDVKHGRYRDYVSVNQFRESFESRS